MARSFTSVIAYISNRPCDTLLQDVTMMEVITNLDISSHVQINAAHVLVERDT